MSDNPATRASVGVSLTRALRTEMRRLGLRSDVRVMISGARIVVHLGHRSEALDIDVSKAVDSTDAGLDILGAACRLVAADAVGQ